MYKAETKVESDRKGQSINEDNTNKEEEERKGEKRKGKEGGGQY